MTNEQANELVKLARQAKADAYSYGGVAILTPGSEASRLLKTVDSIKASLRKNFRHQDAQRI